MMSKFYIKSVLVRDISKSMGDEALRIDPEAPAVNMQRANEQHQSYVKAFCDILGLNIINVPADHSLPDCVFVEDPLVVIGNKALLSTLGHQSRQPEKKEILAAVRKISSLNVFIMDEIDSNARLDGGDVLFTGEEILIGKSSRTNDAGIKVLAQVFSPIPVTPIPVSNGLHLKSFCSLASPSTILIAVGTEPARQITNNIKSLAKKQYKYVEVDGTPCGANSVYLETDKGSVLIHPSPSVYPETEEVYKSIDVDMKIPIDMSEFAKVDGCLTCSSVLLPV